MSSFRQLMMKKKGGGSSSLNPLIVTVGSPTITEDFIYENVGRYSYIYIDEVMPLETADSWKVQFKIHYVASSLYDSPAQPFLAYLPTNGDGKSPVLRVEGSPAGKNHMRPLISAVGYSSWNIAVDTTNVVFVDNTDYYLEYGFDGTKYYVKNLDTNIELWSKNDTRKCACLNKFALFRNGYNNGTEICLGSMDLKTFKIYINNSLYFSAVI